MTTAAPSPAATNLVVSAGPANVTQPRLYGLFYENLNYAGDGGLYAELIRNRAFQGNYKAPPSTSFWSVTGNASIALDDKVPLSTALPNSLKVSSSKGNVGLINPGWWGIEVVGGRKYDGSFYARLQKGSVGRFVASLKSNSTGKVYATTEIPARLSSNWTKISYTLVASRDLKKTTAKDNIFTLTWVSSEETVLNLNLISLFPPTYKNRKNGLRPDLVKVLMDLNPKFLRFPGGTDVQGDTVIDRLQWEHTVGPVEERIGRYGSWGYYQTSGLGLLEYMYLAEDLKADAIMGVYFGYSIKWGANGPEEEAVAEADLAPYVQSVLNQIEYVSGPATSTYGALRAKHGRKEPFDLKFVELGNEDWAGPIGRDSLSYRFKAFYKAIKEKYPHIVVIASSTNAEGATSPDYSRDVVVDQHYYRRPSNWVDMFKTFDSWPRNISTIFVGEYASIQPDEWKNPTNDPNLSVDWSGGPDSRLLVPSMKGAVGEAIFSFGMERNQDVVEFAAYAPLFQNANNNGWTPDLIQFDADEDNTVLSTSYYLQKLLAHNQGTHSLPVKSDANFHPLYWVASRDDAKKSVILKLTHFSANSTTVNVSFPYKLGPGTITTLSADANAYNSQTDRSIVPVEKPIEASPTGNVTFTVPKWSVVVVKFAVKP